MKLINQWQEQAKTETGTMSMNERIEELEPIEKEVLRMKRDLEDLFKRKDIPDFDKKVLRELADECLKFIDMIQRRVEFLGEYV